MTLRSRFSALTALQSGRQNGPRPATELPTFEFNPSSTRLLGSPPLFETLFRLPAFAGCPKSRIVDKTHKLYKAMGATYVGLPIWREDTIGMHFDRQRYLGIFGPALCTPFIPWPKIAADVLVP